MERAPQPSRPKDQPPIAQPASPQAALTPIRRKARTSSELLALFSPTKTPVLSSTKSTHNNVEHSADMGRNLRQTAPVSYAVSESSDGPTSPSATSSAYGSPAYKKRSSEAFESEDDSSDEIQVMVKRPRASYAVRSLRPRPEVSYITKPRQKPKSSRVKSRKPRKSSVIVVSDAITQQEEESVTGFSRTETLSETKVRRDRFLLAKKDFFLPLLPPVNYVQKLIEQAKGAEDDTIVSYKRLEQQPDGVTATMKPYQLTGLSFLVYLNENAISGLLGDEMGLGKTLQTLSLFQYLEEEKLRQQRSDDGRPYLVVCPLSVLNSWVSEAKKWTPGLKVLRFHGPVSERAHLKKVALGQQDKYGNKIAGAKTTKSKHRGKSTRTVATIDDDMGRATTEAYNLVITTYDTFVAEQAWIKKSFQWRYVVLDEGHKIKNHLSLVSTALQGLKAENRLILTGTPLQNSLEELWAILHWLYPEVFTDGTASLFKSSFDLAKGRVNTSVMDDARQLLELVMLRRMKDSPEVDLGLPPKTEILLYVPLTPMQRFWYTRLLTKAGDTLLDDLFKGVKDKEKAARQMEKFEEENSAALEATSEGRSDEWEETEAIVRRAIAEEQNGPTINSAWQRLMNLLMQLRKCCNHPYLLPNAAPEPYFLGEHVIRASGKFIVLEKLLNDLVIKKNKKVLVFSGFTRVLDCCEDLLSVIGGDGSNFKYLRFDGGTGRARRNLNIRMFNDLSTEYKVMLISTKAGGLGINLASASDAIFLDEDWNPQITLQAEARAHRIGQTQPVTIYKLCTQGTVEEQMMGRIRKKLYLSAKITESMKNVYNKPGGGSKKKTAQDSTDDMPHLSTGQLKSLVRRGAQFLAHQEIDVTEMLSWDIDTILEKCKETSPDAQEAECETSEADENAWLSTMERVECAVFDGKKYQRDIDKRNLPFSGASREDRRKDKNTTVMVDGFAISKESMRCADWEAVPTMAGKDPRLAEPKREKRAKVMHQSHCQVCWDGGEIVCCSGCPRTYHFKCLNKTYQPRMSKGSGNFFCPQHECVDCNRKTTDAGGLIFRCRWCERGYCDDCIDWDKTTLVGENLPEYEMVSFPAVTQAFYISCPACHDSPEAQDFIEEQEKVIYAQYVRYTDTLGAGNDSLPNYSDAGFDESMTEGVTLTDTSIGTPIGGAVTPSTGLKHQKPMLDVQILSSLASTN